ncbi:MAG: hypothetical protein Kow0062_04970 [Acidobacteriota bacterium]
MSSRRRGGPGARPVRGRVILVAALLAASGPAVVPEDVAWETRAASIASELLGALIDLDEQVRFVLHAGRKAGVEPFAGHRINRVLDPYSLALHQEGRGRRDPLARLMREATLAAASHEAQVERTIQALDATERAWLRERQRLVDAITRLRALALQLEADKAPNRARARLVARRTVAQIDNTLARIGLLGQRVVGIVRQAELSWSRVREPAQRAMPAENEVRAPTERFAEAMIGEILAIEYELRAASEAVRTGAYRLQREATRIRRMLAPLLEAS